MPSFEIEENEDKQKSEIIKTIILSILIIIITLILFNFEFISNTVKQYQVGEYQNNYGNKVDLILSEQDKILKDNYFILNYNSSKINQQIEIINNLINDYNNYNPGEINKNLHFYNINLLNTIVNKYKIQMLLENDYTGLNIKEQMETVNKDISNIKNQYRTELINIFDKINMTYLISETGKVKYTFKKLDINYFR